MRKNQKRLDFLKVFLAVSKVPPVIETIYEPYLLQIGFLERTPRGRKATGAAYKHLGFDEPKQNTLL